MALAPQIFRLISPHVALYFSRMCAKFPTETAPGTAQYLSLEHHVSSFHWISTLNSICGWLLLPERVEAVQPGEGEAPGRHYSSLPVPEGACKKAGEGLFLRACDRQGVMAFNYRGQI